MYNDEQLGGIDSYDDMIVVMTSLVPLSSLCRQLILGLSLFVADDDELKPWDNGSSADVDIWVKKAISRLCRARFLLQSSHGKSVLVWSYT